jgi:radical SAM protein with 4Fe4S-binding SPASM domain
MLQPCEFPRICGPWRIRNDGANSVIYRCATDALSFKICTPVEASVVPFLDGAYPYNEIRSAWSDAVSQSATRGVQDMDLPSIFDRTLSALIADAKLVTSDGDPSPSYGQERHKLFPNFHGYRYPAPRLERPIAVNIAITNRCVCDCIYCYAERRCVPEMKFARLVSLFDELSANEVYLVDIVGGDLFTHRDALRIMEEMVKRDFVFFVSTKSWISRQQADHLRELGIGIPDPVSHLRRDIQVSVDSIDQECAQLLTGNKHYVERATQTITNLVAAGLAPKVKCVLTSHNASAPESLIDHFVGLGVKDFQFVQYGRTYYRHDDALFLSKEQKKRIRKKINDMQDKYPFANIEYQDNKDDTLPRRKTAEQWADRAECSGGRISMLIQPNGDVTLCDQMPHSDQYAVGNVFEDGLLGSWKSKKLEQFIYPDREKFEGTVCYTCRDFDQCHGWQGYCYRDSLFHYGSAFDAPPDCPRQSKKGLREI